MVKQDKDDLSTSRAEEILGLRKEFEDRQPLEITQGSKVVKELTAVTLQLVLVFDLTFYGPGRFSLQVRLAPPSHLVLVRLDVGASAVHKNPDDALVPAPHLHLYRQGYNDGFAYPIDPSDFRDISDLNKTYDDFCRKFNIGKRPKIVVEG